MYDVILYGCVISLAILEHMTTYCANAALQQDMKNVKIEKYNLYK